MRNALAEYSSGSGPGIRLFRGTFWGHTDLENSHLARKALESAYAHVNLRESRGCASHDRARCGSPVDITCLHPFQDSTNPPNHSTSSLTNCGSAYSRSRFRHPAPAYSRSRFRDPKVRACPPRPSAARVDRLPTACCSARLAHDHDQDPLHTRCSPAAFPTRRTMLPKDRCRRCTLCLPNCLPRVTFSFLFDHHLPNAHLSRSAA
jgi:hypothetical protein